MEFFCFIAMPLKLKQNNGVPLTLLLKLRRIAAENSW